MCDQCWDEVQQRKAEASQQSAGEYDESICPTDKLQWAYDRPAVRGKWGGKQW